MYMVLYIYKAIKLYKIKKRNKIMKEGIIKYKGKNIEYIIYYHASFNTREVHIKINKKYYNDIHYLYGWNCRIKVYELKKYFINKIKDQENLRFDFKDLKYYDHVDTMVYAFKN